MVGPQQERKKMDGVCWVNLNEQVNYNIIYWLQLSREKDGETYKTVMISN